MRIVSTLITLKNFTKNRVTLFTSSLEWFKLQCMHIMCVIYVSLNYVQLACDILVSMKIYGRTPFACDIFKQKKHKILYISRIAGGRDWWIAYTATKRVQHTCCMIYAIYVWSGAHTGSPQTPHKHTQAGQHFDWIIKSDLELETRAFVCVCVCTVFGREAVSNRCALIYPHVAAWSACIRDRRLFDFQQP